MKHEWQERFVKLAEHIASWSKDNSTKVGAVIVDDTKRIVSTGYNGFPQGVNDDVISRHERPTKYLYFEHAERNAIFTAGRNGVSLQNTTLICTMFPCADCSRAIIQSGIKTVISPKPSEERWSDSHEAALAMLTEAKVEVILTT